MSSANINNDVEVAEVYDADVDCDKLSNVAQVNNNFTKYSSIKIYNKKLIDTIINLGYGSEEWVSCEKIDGANFSCILTENDNKINRKYARRTDILAEGEAFFNYMEVDKKYGDCFDQLFKLVAKSKYNNTSKDESLAIQVVGELYGGLYPNIKSKFSKIQKNVFYCADIDFRSFDILINGKLINYDDAINFLKTANIPYCNIMHRGKLFDLLKLNPIFDSQLYKDYNLPFIKDNVAEGYVIKPINPRWLPSGERVIIKLKNPKYAEKSSTKEVKQITTEFNDIQLDDTVKAILKEALNYIVENRLNNVLSKMIESEKIQRAKVIGFLVKDAFNDFIEDNKDNKDIEKNKKIITTYMSKEAHQLYNKVCPSAY
jgi:Rnl2 family RNA ligase